MICYIHGANASSTSFNYLREHLPKGVVFNYDAQFGLRANTTLLAEECRRTFGDEPFDVIAHSMGGLLAVMLSQSGANVGRIISLSTPYGGSDAASYLRWLYPTNRIYQDITPGSLCDLRSTPLRIPVDAFVTTGGSSPLLQGDNDGVVTVASQRALPGATYHECKLNHFEILLSSDVAEEIKIILES